MLSLLIGTLPHRSSGGKNDHIPISDRLTTVGVEGVEIYRCVEELEVHMSQ